MTTIRISHEFKKELDELRQELSVRTYEDALRKVINDYKNFIKEGGVSKDDRPKLTVEEFKELCKQTSNMMEFVSNCNQAEFWSEIGRMIEVRVKKLDRDLIRSIIVEETPKLINLPESIDLDKFKIDLKEWFKEEASKLISLPEGRLENLDEIRQWQVAYSDLINDLDERLSALEAAIPKERVEQAIKKRAEEENRKLQEMQRYGKNLTPDFKTADKSITQ